MIIHIDSSTAEIVDDILTRASEVSAPLKDFLCDEVLRLLLSHFQLCL
jgi:hypothetical protein